MLAGIPLSAESAPTGAAGNAADSGTLSPHLKAALSTELPAYDPPKPAASDVAAKLVLEKANASVSEVHVLPRITIRDSVPPQAEDMFTTDAKLDRYLGPKAGLDRGLLNKVVLHWGDGWLQFALFDADTNETRAQVRELDDLRLRHRAELLDFAAEMKDTGDEEFAKQIKLQSDHLFSREPPFTGKPLFGHK